MSNTCFINLCVASVHPPALISNKLIKTCYCLFVFPSPCSLPFPLAGKSAPQSLHEVCGARCLFHHLPGPAGVQRLGSLRGHQHAAQCDRHRPPAADLSGQDHALLLDWNSHHGVGGRWGFCWCYIHYLEFINTPWCTSTVSRLRQINAWSPNR